MSCSLFFFKQKTADEMRISDWSSDVCSSDLLAELGAVGHVQVDVEDRVPGVDQRQHRLHFRRVGLQVVAVEVVVLRGGAPAHFLGAALVGAVPAPEALVAVDVEHRHEQQHLAVERAGRGLRSEEHTSELQSLMRISYAVFCLKKKKQT